jgi:hypothetical protein
MILGRWSNSASVKVPMPSEGWSARMIRWRRSVSFILSNYQEGMSRITAVQKDPRTEAKKVIEIEQRQLVHLFAVGITIHNVLSDGGLALLGANMDNEIA